MVIRRRTQYYEILRKVIALHCGARYVTEEHGVPLTRAPIFLHKKASLRVDGTAELSYRASLGIALAGCKVGERWLGGVLGN